LLRRWRILMWTLLELGGGDDLIKFDGIFGEMDCAGMEENVIGKRRE
jgi:hypothetical protein